MESNKLVSKSNALIEANYTLNLVAQRLIVLAIINAREKGDMSQVNGLHRVSALEYQKHFECALPMAYESLKSACDNLYESEFIWHDKDEKGDMKINRSRFVQRASYSEGNGYVEIMFGTDVIPLITRLSKEYTEYELKQIKNLNSVYALRVFEMLMQWRSVGKTQLITIEKLRSQLGIEEHQYLIMSNFKKRVLDLAINEINTHTDITATYEQHKQGRNITGFTFKFKKKKVVNQIAKPDKFINFSPKQLELFSHKLAKLNELGGDAPIGGTTEQYATIIANDLADSVGQVKYIKYLEKLGFKLDKNK